MTTATPPRDTAHADRTRRTPLFQPSSLAECPNWRYLIANHLAQEADDQFPAHADPWINDTAELLYVGLQKIPDFEGSMQQRHIRDAFLLRQQGALVVKVLECYLAGGFTFDEILSRCDIKRGVLEAYAAVLCDVEDHCRTQGWARLQMNPLVGGRGQVRDVTSFLQRSFFFGAAEGVAEAVDVLCQVEGPTLADGLPPRNTPNFLHEFGVRSDLAQTLLTRSKKNCQLMQQFEDAHSGVAPGTPMNEEAIDIGLQILRRVQITKSLQMEITQLREFCRKVPQPAMTI